MEETYCKYCGLELLEYDLHGNQWLNCPRGCDDEAAIKEAEINFQNDVPDIYEQVTERVTPKKTRCWACETKFYRSLENQDGPYGNFCPDCNESLRKHRIYGQGKPGDLGRK